MQYFSFFRRLFVQLADNQTLFAAKNRIFIKFKKLFL